MPDHGPHTSPSAMARAGPPSTISKDSRLTTKTLDLEKRLLGQWNALVRRARIGRDRKVAALTVSSYANADGTGIRLSVARYAVDLEVSYSTARRYLEWLRKVGLLEMTRVGSRRAGTASEYRLILGPDVLEELDVLTPAEQKERADEMRVAQREGSRERGVRKRERDQRSSQVSVEVPVDNSAGEVAAGADQRSPGRALMEPINAQMGADQRSPRMNNTPSRTHLSDLERPSRADDEDLRTAVTPSRATHEPRPSKCSHGLAGGLRRDGLPACALCRRDARPGQPPPEPPPIAPVIDLDSRRTA